MKRNSIFYEFYKNGTFVRDGMRITGPVKITTGVDSLPTMSLRIPLEDLPENNMSNYDIKIMIQVENKLKYVFWGVVDNMEIDFANYQVSLNLSHRVARMREWTMPAGYTVKSTNISHIIGEGGVRLGEPSTVFDKTLPYYMKVNIKCLNDPTIEHEFSSTDKLSALSELVEATEKCHWRVLLNTDEPTIEIGEFGEEADVEISPNPVFEDGDEPAPARYVTMLTEPTFNVDYTDHYNRAVVFCGDVGAGVFHLTLKEVYEDESLQLPGFPVGMYDQEINLQPEPEYDDNDRAINNEKVYKENELVVFAPNTNREYFVTDTQQLEEDGGIVKSTNFTFANMHPIPKLSETDEDGNEIEYQITDNDRIEIAKRAYYKAIRELKAQRPEYTYQFNCTALPLYDGDGVSPVDGCTVHFTYSKDVADTDNDDPDCPSKGVRKIVNVDVKYYMTNRIITFDSVLNEYATITLDRELRPRAIDAVEWELSENAAGDGGGYSRRGETFGQIKVEYDTSRQPDTDAPVQGINGFSG